MCVFMNLLPRVFTFQQYICCGGNIIKWAECCHHKMGLCSARSGFVLQQTCNILTTYSEGGEMKSHLLHLMNWTFKSIGGGGRIITGNSFQKSGIGGGSVIFLQLYIKHVGVINRKLYVSPKFISPLWNPAV